MLTFSSPPFFSFILEFDDNTDFDVAMEAAQGKSCLLGNVAVSEVMTHGTPEMVRDACRRRIEKIMPRSGYILSSGCALSANAPAENLHAMVAAAEEYGVY
jgi:uroporphyrinogen-III decarboxylase